MFDSNPLKTKNKQITEKKIKTTLLSSLMSPGRLDTQIRFPESAGKGGAGAPKVQLPCNKSTYFAQRKYSLYKKRALLKDIILPFYHKIRG